MAPTRAVILKTLLATQLTADHANRQREWWALHRALIHYHRKRIAVSIGDMPRQLPRNHKKKSSKQASVAPPSTGLEPWQSHHPKGTWYPLDWCPRTEHRSWVGDNRRCTAAPMMLLPWLLQNQKWSHTKNSYVQKNKRENCFQLFLVSKWVCVRCYLSTQRASNTHLLLPYVQWWRLEYL